MKVLGCKVSDEIYQQFKNIGRPLSDSLREAIHFYLTHMNTTINSSVYQTETKVNRDYLTSTNKPLDKNNQWLTTNTSPTMTNQTSSSLSKQKHSTPPPSKPNPTAMIKGYTPKIKRTIPRKRLLDNRKRIIHPSSKDYTFHCPYCSNLIYIPPTSKEQTNLFCPYCHNKI